MIDVIRFEDLLIVDPTKPAEGTHTIIPMEDGTVVTTIERGNRRVTIRLPADVATMFGLSHVQSASVATFVAARATKVGAAPPHKAVE